MLAENDGQSYPLNPGARHHPIIRHHASITWIGGPTNFSKLTYVKPRQQPGARGPAGQPLDQRRGLVGLAHGRPTIMVGPRPTGPIDLHLQRGSSPLVLHVFSRSDSFKIPSRKGWLPPIYMKGGAPFRDNTQFWRTIITQRCSSHLLL